MKFFDNDAKMFDEKFEQVIEAISTKDKATLKAMFSKQAISETNDFDENLDYLCDFFQGTIKSHTRDAGPIVDEFVDHGNKIKEVKTWYSVETNKQKYLLFLLEYSSDTSNSDNVGLYTLRVIHTENEKEQFGSWQDMKAPGIYRPES